MYDFLIFFVCGAGLLLMGVYSLYENKKNIHNLFFSLTTFFAFLWILFLYLMYALENIKSASLIMTRFANGTPFLVIISLFYFFYFFPSVTLKIKKKYQTIGIGFILLMFLVTVLTPLVQKDITILNNEIDNEKLGILFPLFSITTISSSIFLIIFTIKKIKSLFGIEKTKLRIIAFSFALVAFFASLTNNILPQFGIIVFVKESILYILFFLAACFYSITKHRFFHLSYFSLNLFRKFLFIITSLVIVLFFYSFFQFLVQDLNEFTKIVLVTVLSIYAFTKIYVYFPEFTSYDLKQIKQIIVEFRSNIYYCETWNKLINYLEKTFTKSLNIDQVKLYVVRKNNNNSTISIYERNKFTSILSKLKLNILQESEIEYLKTSQENKKTLKEELENLKAKIVVPLFAEHKFIGFLTIGVRRDQNYYRKEELNEFEKINKDLEIVLMNLLLKLNLQEENNLMKEIIEQKTEALRKQFQEIKALLEQQSDFIAVTAHEFRTPLSIALFQLEDTLSSHSHSPQVMQDMEVMNESLNNLKELTQKLFDVQQYDLNKIKLRGEETDIVEFIKQLYSEFNLIMKDKEIKFEFINKMDSSAKLQIDKSQFRQVMNNLLNNAVKFIDTENPLIQMKLEQDGKSTIVSILNTGEPIPDKDKERIFEKFQTTKVTMGTGIGLGLYICKKIIELHNGKIWVTNEKNMTKVSISLRN